MITSPKLLSTLKSSVVYRRPFFNPFGRCILCNSQSKRSLDLCLGCENDLPAIVHACTRCGIPLIDELINRDSQTAETESSQAFDFTSCGQCLAEQPPQSQTTALFSYEFPVDRLITRTKFSGKTAYAKVLGHLLAEKIKNTYTKPELPEAIIPVPLSKQRLQQRGFNQATLIARPIAKNLGIPLLVNHCERIIHTDEQSSLNANKRRHNVRNAFSIRKPFINKQKSSLRHVAIVDDVMTTGATLEALAKTLLKSGVEQVDFWVVARTPE